jgi:Outer membrane protein beta-barrel family
LLSLHTNNIYSKSPAIIQQYVYVLPTFTFSGNGINAGYRVNVNEPSAYDLRLINDNPNPLYQTIGNPDLRPMISHTFNAGYYKYFNKKLLSFNFYSNLNIDKNAIIRSRTIDDQGVQITRPVNINGTWRFYASGGFSKLYKFQKNAFFSFRPGFNYNFSRSFILVNNNRSMVKNTNIGPSLSLSLNWKDKIELNQRYNFTWRKNKYENNAFHTGKAINHSSFSEIVIRVPRNWVWESSIDYRYNP